MRALRCLLLLGLLSSVAAFAGSGEHTERLDPQVYKHYEAACTAFAARQFHRALAEIELVLLPKTKVFVDARPGTDPHRAALAGIALWKEALGEDAPFELTTNREDAQVTVTFPKDCSGEGKEICGHVEWRRKAMFGASSHTAFVTAAIEVGLGSPDGHKHDLASLTHIVAHELGHVLGLEDTDSVADVMGPDLHGNPAIQLSAVEAEAVRSLRARCHELRASVTDAATARK